MGFNAINRAQVRRRKHFSVRKKISGTTDRPRLVVFRSTKNIYVQLVDDVNHKTLTGVSTLTPDVASDLKGKQTKTEQAKLVGKAIADKAKDLKIKEVVFDRAGYIYHGRVKAVAEGARENGLKF